MEYTDDQKQALNQILLQTVTEAPVPGGKNMDNLIKLFSQKKPYRNADSALKKPKTEPTPDDRKLLRVTVPVTDGQTTVLNSTGDAASDMLNQAFGDYIAPDTGDIKIFVAAASTSTAQRKNGAGIINLGSFTMDITASAFKSLAVKALTRLADPKEGAAMLGISEEEYKKQLADKGSALARRVGEIITNAGFIKTEQQVVDLVQAVNDVQQFEFAAVLNDAVAQLPEMGAKATKADTVKHDRKSKPQNFL